MIKEDLLLVVGHPRRVKITKQKRFVLMKRITGLALEKEDNLSKLKRLNESTCVELKEDIPLELELNYNRSKREIALESARLQRKMKKCTLKIQ